MDFMTPAERSARMALIRSKDTKPELTVRSLLHRLGYRFRVHRRDLPGSPDLTFPSRKKVIFVHGCFWHAHKGCNLANRPSTRRLYWDEKFRRNKARDQRNTQLLGRAGWDVHIVWECEVKNRAILIKQLIEFLGPAKIAASIGKSSHG